ncbi:glycosyltransferase [Aquipluma nitroreducens]|uniref:Glycosyltransferase n=1 Tax=Aquipluma nitroreducens TaxID=2010828 RepID=A0A5K7SBE0_9BACT|nr:glycosyltransferase family 2 protein [Aquipluma nitroreducens]BBE18888.1 glycosyltransferase [Aquipluma nitroreducens]
MVEKIDSTKNIIPLIILNWNGEYDTIECLKSIKKSDNNRFLPVVIDNGSKVDSLDILKKNCSQLFENILYTTKEKLNNSHNLVIDLVSSSNLKEALIFIENNENLGFAKGNNIGIKIAKMLDTDWVMLLNNDTEIRYDALTALNKFINANNEIAAITPQIRLFKDKDKIWNCGGRLTFFGSRKYFYAEENIDKVPGKGYSFITFITGCALVFQYKKTGILTEDFFFGEEDYEFSLRLKKNNLNMVCLYDSIIYHKVGSTIKKSNNIISTIYLYYINRLINTRNYYSDFRWQITRFLSYLYLPILLKKNNINPLKSYSLINDINKYIAINKTVSDIEFHKAMIKC